jgi:hypothetical protein
MNNHDRPEQPWIPATETVILQDQSTNTSASVTVPKSKRGRKPRLTGKQRKLARIIATEPQTSHREAYQRVYDAGNMSIPSIDSEVYKTLNKPLVKIELSKYTDQMKGQLIELAGISLDYARDGGRDGASYAGVAERTMNSIIDRVEGKAKQSIDLTNTSVTINIDLTAST